MPQPTTGTLFRRSNGIWYLKAEHGGREIIRESCRTRDREEAERYRERRMAPFRYETQLQRQRAMLELIATTKQALAEARAYTFAVKLQDAWAAFAKDVNRPQCGKCQWAAYKRAWDMFVAWLGDTYPECVDVQDVAYRPHAVAFAQWVDEQGYSAGTYNKIMNKVGLVFKVLEPITNTANPFHNMRRKRHQARGRRRLSAEELRRVCAPLEGEMRLLFAIGIFTGLRLKDAVYLNWGDIDLKNQLIVTAPHKMQHVNGLVHIPIHRILHNLLVEIDPFNRVGFVMPGLADLYRLKGASVVSAKITEAFVAAGIETREDRPDGRRRVCVVGYHSLRHTFVSLCAEAGVPAAVVASLVGHASVAMQQTYTHIGLDAQRKAIGSIESFEMERDT